MKKALYVLSLLLYLLFPNPGTAVDLGELTGYTLVKEVTVDGDFEGCDFGKRIRFTDGTHLKCSTFSYTYSFMPTAYIFMRKTAYKGKGVLFVKMVVEDTVYDMEPLIPR